MNDESVQKLFLIIRYQDRALTWKQFYDYFKFLLRIKSHVNEAILRQPKAWDYTLSPND